MEKLAEEITSNILSRLPIRSLAQSRCVSKLWFSLLSDPTFPSLQLPQHSKIDPDIILLYVGYDNGPSMCYVEDNQFNDDEEIPNIIKPFNFKTFDSDFLARTFYKLPSILGCCNGFICLSELNFLDKTCFILRNPIYMFNPITQEHTKLPHFIVTDEQSNFTSTCLSGFGYQDSTKEFKLVLGMFKEFDSKSQTYNHNEVQVHTLGSTTWRRKIGTVPGVLCRAVRKVSVAFVDGCLHWITIDQSSPNEGPLIVSFSLGVEEFGFVPTPESNLLNHPLEKYQLGMLEESLSLIECSYEPYIHIWVMNKYNVKESWVKQYSIKQHSVCRLGLEKCSVNLIKLCKNGELLLVCNREYLVSYNTTSQKCRFLKVEGVPSYIRRGYPLVGSLISLKSACRRMDN